MHPKLAISGDSGMFRIRWNFSGEIEVMDKCRRTAKWSL
jgi:hypothetical protein